MREVAITRVCREPMRPLFLAVAAWNNRAYDEKSISWIKDQTRCRACGIQDVHSQRHVCGLWPVLQHLMSLSDSLGPDLVGQLNVVRQRWSSAQLGDLIVIWDMDCWCSGG